MKSSEKTASPYHLTKSTLTAIALALTVTAASPAMAADGDPIKYHAYSYGTPIYEGQFDFVDGQSFGGSDAYIYFNDDYSFYVVKRTDDPGSNRISVGSSDTTYYGNSSAQTEFGAYTAFINNTDGALRYSTPVTYTSGQDLFFINNSGRDGALSVDTTGANLTFSRPVTFVGNTMNNGNRAGAIYFDSKGDTSGKITFNDKATFVANSSARGGAEGTGAIINKDGGTITFNGDTVFVGHSENGGSHVIEKAAVLYNNNATTTFHGNTVFAGNMGSNFGIVMNTNGGTINLAPESGKKITFETFDPDGDRSVPSWGTTLIWTTRYRPVSVTVTTTQRLIPNTAIRMSTGTPCSCTANISRTTLSSAES